MIKKFDTKAALDAAGLPTTESRLAYAGLENIAQIDGVNVETTVPQWADAVFTDADGGIHIIMGGTLNRALIPSTWEYKGPFMYHHDEGTYALFGGDLASLPNLKYCDVVQFELAAPTLDGEEHSASIACRVNTDYNTAYTIPFTYSATTLEEVAAALNAAIEEKKAADGWTDTLWAYVADDGYNKVETGGTKIVVQFDSWVDYRQYLCAGMTHVTWRGVPESDTYFKSNGRVTNYRGLMNIEVAASYWGANSSRVLTAPVAVHSEAGNTDPMKKSDFLTSEYAADLRAYYGTYEAYLEGEFGIAWPQKFGAFRLPKGKYMIDKYGPVTAPTKSGGTKAVFPAFSWAYNLGGDSHLWDLDEGVMLLKDANLRALNATQAKMGEVTLANNSNRWFAARYNVYSAWFFYGNHRNLTISNVCSASQCGAVSLLKHK